MVWKDSENGISMGLETVKRNGTV